MCREKVDERLLSCWTEGIVGEVDGVQVRVVEKRSQEVSQTLRDLCAKTRRKDIAKPSDLELDCSTRQGGEWSVNIFIHTFRLFLVARISPRSLHASTPYVFPPK
jgi:hypothetical protein